MAIRRSLLFFASLGLLLPAAALIAQQGSNRVSIAFAVLLKPLDSKSAKAGDSFTLRTARDILIDGKAVIPRASTLDAHLAETPDTSGKSIAIVLDDAVLHDGRKIPIQGIISAIAPPTQQQSLSEDPSYGMMHSNEPTASAASAGNASSGAAVATAGLKQVTDPGWRLSDDSQGAVQMPELSLRWLLDQPPPTTVIETKKKSFKLPQGTQMVIRMAEPRM